MTVPALPDVLDAIPREQIPAAIARLAARAMEETPQPNGAPSETDASEMLSAREAAALLGQSVRWVYDHAQELRAERHGRSVRVPSAAVERYRKRMAAR